VKIGDIVRWRRTGQMSIYLGIKNNRHQFYSSNYTVIVERSTEHWSDAWIEVISHA